MALRGAPARRLQGNALGGILRDLDRRTRTTTRRRGKPSTPEVREGPPGPPGPQGPPGTSTAAAAVVVTGADGRARWAFPAPYEQPPVVAAVAVDPDPGGGQTVMVALEEVEAAYVVLRVWRTQPRRRSGVAEPVGAGVRVHVTVCPGCG